MILTALLVMTFASVARADELAPPDRVGGKDVFTFLGKDFTTDAEACAAGTPKADGWSPNGASAPNKAGMIECHYKHKDGERGPDRAPTPPH